MRAIFSNGPTVLNVAAMSVLRAKQLLVDPIYWLAVNTLPRKEFIMNQDTMAGNWKQMKGKLKEQWGKLTDDDLDVAAGKRDQLLGRIQERYGIAKEEAETQMKEFEKRYLAAAK
jgi:uncharacterized protein YjbJ (UPF0337 family)